MFRALGCLLFLLLVEECTSLLGLQNNAIRPTVNQLIHGPDTLEKNTIVPSKKLLIVMSDTGGGHRMSADAIRAAIKSYQDGGDLDVKIVDLLTTHGHYPLNKAVPWYRGTAKNPTAWGLGYTLSSIGMLQTPLNKLVNLLSLTSIEEGLRKENPDLILSVHPLCQYPTIHALKTLNKERTARGEKAIPLITVVTDLASAHPTWFDKRVDALYVPSPHLLQAARAREVPEDKILMKGLPLKEQFWGDKTAPLPWKQEVRASLNLSPERKTVLLMGGGEGLGDLVKVAKSVKRTLQKAVFDSQMVIICGNNHKLKEKLEKELGRENNGRVEEEGEGERKRETGGRNGTLFSLFFSFASKLSQPSPTFPPPLPPSTAPPSLSSSSLPHTPSNPSQNHKTATTAAAQRPKVKIVLKNFVDNIGAYMSASDLLVTKAGPGTIAEAMTRGLPMLLSSYLPGQESGNLQYVEDLGVGYACVGSGWGGKSVTEKMKGEGDGKGVLGGLSPWFQKKKSKDGDSKGTEWGKTCRVNHDVEKKKGEKKTCPSPSSSPSTSSSSFSTSLSGRLQELLLGPDNQKLKEMSRRARHFSAPQAAREIARDILDVMLAQ